MAEHEFETPGPAGTYTAFAWITADVDPWLPAIARLLEVPDCERVLIAAGPTRSLDLLPEDDRIEVRGGRFLRRHRRLAARGSRPARCC